MTLARQSRARGWRGVPSDNTQGWDNPSTPHYMVLRIDRNTTLREAEAWCARNATCAGFYFPADGSVPSNDAPTNVWYKDATQAFWMDGADHARWASRVKASRAPPFRAAATANAGDAAKAADSCFGQQVWAKRLPGGAFAVLFVNVGQPTLASFELPIDVLARAAGAASAEAYAVRDVWAHADLPGIRADAPLRFEAVLGHDSRFLVLTPTGLSLPPMPAAPMPVPQQPAPVPP